MASRSLNDLHPTVKAKAEEWLKQCKAAGIDILVTCTYRSGDEQNALYAQGRTKPGPKVTNAKAGQSFHQYKVALDFVVMVGGKPDWSGTNPGWLKAITLAEKLGFESGYRWKSFKEMPHLQYTGGKALSHFQAGGTL